MKLYINEEEYTLSDDSRDDLLWMLWLETLDKYEKLDPAFKLALGLWSRKQIYDMERKSGNKELRPPRGSDPVIHLGQIIFSGIKEGLSGVSLYIKADDNNTITAHSWQFKGKSESGG